MSKKLFYKTIKVQDISETHKFEMFNVFRRYYDNVSEEQFKKDLMNKDAVFVLFDKKEKKVRGFSTIVELNCNSNRGFFSGDTIIEKEYWGQGTLGVAFLKYLFVEKLKNPFKPLYWFLISKGFKTYLLMANNFSNHYPRFEKETDSKHREILSSFAKKLYPNEFIEELGIISFKENIKDSLKDCVAPITEEMKKENARINFFATKNKGWQRGDELCCIAEMTLTMPFKYQYKKIKKNLMKSLSKKEIKKSKEILPAVEQTI